MVANNSPPSPSLTLYACKNAAESVPYSPWFIKPASIFLQIRRSVRGRDDGNSFVTLVKCREGCLWVTSNSVSALPLSEQPTCQGGPLSPAWRRRWGPQQDFAESGGSLGAKLLATGLQRVPAHREEHARYCERCQARWSCSDLNLQHSN